MEIEGFSFQPPPGFRTEEMTVGLRMGLPGGGPSPSLIVQSKQARAGAALPELAVEIFTELAHSVPKMKDASKSELTFADGGVGALLAYTFPTQTGELRQYFALRLHAGRLCTVTLTVPLSTLNELNAQSFLAAIASVKPS